MNMFTKTHVVALIFSCKKNFVNKFGRKNFICFKQLSNEMNKHDFHLAQPPTNISPTFLWTRLLQGVVLKMSGPYKIIVFTQSLRWESSCVWKFSAAEKTSCLMIFNDLDYLALTDSCRVRGPDAEPRATRVC